MRVAIGLDFFEPILNVREGVLASNIIDEKGPDGTPVVGSCDRSEVLLAGSIPNLEFNTFLLDGNGLGAKLHSDCYIVGCSRLILDELEHHAGFPHARVPDHDELEQVMVCVHLYIIA